MRLNKPIGFMLLFWPCSWGFALSLIENPISQIWFYYLVLFFIGSILMRSAGCVYNDIVDKKIDSKVSRTKNRPLASKKVSVLNAWVLIVILTLISSIILFQFNFTSILFGLSSGFLILLYPFMKRITYWPQLFLGIIFNWGIILSWLVLNESLNFSIFILYVSAILWTLGYDTIYGLQDIEDDIRIGVKSTSILFKKNIKKFLSVVFFLSFFLLIISTLLMSEKINFSLILYIIPFTLLIYQIKKVEIKNSNKNLSLFKLNNYYGLSIFLIQILTFNYA